MSMPVISHTLLSECSKNSRGPSFSSYLDVTEETFVLQLRETTVKSECKNSLNSATDNQLLPGKKKLEDLEIDVFNAERYFNDGLNPTRGVPNKNLQKQDISSSLPNTKMQPPLGSPSICSESSRNSRSALLQQTCLRNHQQNRRSNRKSGFLNGGCCNFSCTDKNSVTIDDHQHFETCSSTRFPNGRSRQGDDIYAGHLVGNSQLNHKFDNPVLRVNSGGHFSFPVFAPKTENQMEKKIQVEVQQKPVEVLEKRKNCWNLEKDFTWEEPGIFSIGNQVQSDGESIASSSDLFEIESLSNGNPFLSRQTSRNGYAPSEASIEWSVITASAADFSIMSDCEELTNTVLKSKNEKGLKNILSGCKSEKSVRVVGDAHRVSNYDNKKQLKSEPFTLGTGSTKRIDVNVRNRKKSFDARVLVQTNPGSNTYLL